MPAFINPLQWRTVQPHAHCDANSNKPRGYCGATKMKMRKCMKVQFLRWPPEAPKTSQTEQCKPAALFLFVRINTTK